MTTSQPGSRPPPAAWHQPSHALWAQGQALPAIESLLSEINRHGAKKPTPLVLQLVYYLFLRGDSAAAAQCLTQQHHVDPTNNEVLLNLAVCLSRSGQAAAAVEQAQTYLTRKPDDPVAWDVLANNLHATGRDAEAAQAGTRALVLKSQLAAPAPGLVQGVQQVAKLVQPLPAGAPPGQHNVITFSLWGAKRRYLWGALDNLLAAQQLYPTWQVRIYLDDTVPTPWQQALQTLGARLLPQPAGQTLRQRLCWRFLAASDPGVHRFLVRDIDSVVNERECAAVSAWVASGKHFHVMRDWWTHTDPMLAGLWGGVAGVLPPLHGLLTEYKSAAMETPNIDQWFLRDMVWPLVREHCLVHDRCFSMPGSLPWPTPTPAGLEHVGQDAHAADARGQEARLQPYLQKLPPL